MPCYVIGKASDFFTEVPTQLPEGEDWDGILVSFLLRFCQVLHIFSYPSVWLEEACENPQAVEIPCPFISTGDSQNSLFQSLW